MGTAATLAQDCGSAVRASSNSLQILYEGSKNSRTHGAFTRGQYSAVRLGRNNVDRRVAPRAADLCSRRQSWLRSCRRAMRGPASIDSSTVEAIVTKMLIPSLADRILAKSGKASERDNQSAVI